MHESGEIYFRQLLAGEQVAQSHPVAGQMRNFMYLVGDASARQALIVDPAWDVDSLLAVAADDDVDVVGALVTHYHPDHVGGDLFGLQVDGVATLLERLPVPLYVNRNEAEGLKKVTGVSDTDLKLVEGGDRAKVGEVEIEFLHTPGHTPGSQCFLVDGRLISGDTLFVQGCGRVDLPGGDADEMYRSLTQRLSKLSADTVLYPGHDYGPSRSSTLGEEREQNFYMRVPTLEQWRQMMAGG